MGKTKQSEAERFRKLRKKKDKLHRLLALEEYLVINEPRTLRKFDAQYAAQKEDHGTTPGPSLEVATETKKSAAVNPTTPHPPHELTTSQNEEPPPELTGTSHSEEPTLEQILAECATTPLIDCCDTAYDEFLDKINSIDF